MDRAFSSAAGSAAVQSRINTSNNGNTEINYQTYTGFLLLQSMEHADTVPHFKRRGSSKPVSIPTLSMSFCFCFGVQPRHRSWKACCPASCELCGDRRSLCWEPMPIAFQQAWLCAQVLCLWWCRAFDAQNHQHHTLGSSPWYRRFASGFVEEDVFVGSARCATFRLCSRALRIGTTNASKSTGVQMVCEDRLRKLWDQIAFTSKM